MRVGGVALSRNGDDVFAMRIYVVYIVASLTRVLYVGVTSNLKQRIWQHREKLADGFTKRYNVDRLVYYEVFRDVYRAIEREKALKGVRRQRKLELVDAANPTWRDLYDEI